METLYFGQTTKLRTPINPTLNVTEFTLMQQPNGEWATGTYATLALQLPALPEETILRAELEHEFDNENPANPNAPYRYAGVQTEHFYMWAMHSTCVVLGSGANIGSSGAPVPSQSGTKYIITPKETNWDWLIHHSPVSRTGTIKLATEIPAGMYVYDRVYFKSGGSYTDPTRANQMQINAGSYPRLTVHAIG